MPCSPRREKNKQTVVIDPGGGVALWEMLGVLRDVAPSTDARLKEIAEMRPESMQIGRKLEKRKGTARKKETCCSHRVSAPFSSALLQTHCLPRDSSLLVPFWTPVLGRSVSVSPPPPPHPPGLRYHRISPPPWQTCSCFKSMKVRLLEISAGAARELSVHTYISPPLLLGALPTEFLPRGCNSGVSLSPSRANSCGAGVLTRRGAFFSPHSIPWFLGIGLFGFTHTKQNQFSHPGVREESA